MCSYWLGQTRDTERSHLESICVFGDIMVAVAARALTFTLRLLNYFNPGADDPRLWQQLCYSQHHASLCNLEWCPSSSLSPASILTKEKLCNKVGQRSCNLLLQCWTTQLSWVSEEGVTLPPTLSHATLIALQCTEKCDMKQMRRTAIENSFLGVVALWCNASI